MDRYLIETPHTGQECLILVKELNAQGFLWNFDWGMRSWDPQRMGHHRGGK